MTLAKVAKLVENKTFSTFFPYPIMATLRKKLVSNSGVTKNSGQIGSLNLEALKNSTTELTTN